MAYVHVAHDCQVGNHTTLPIIPSWPVMFISMTGRFWGVYGRASVLPHWGAYHDSCRYGCLAGCPALCHGSRQYCNAFWHQCRGAETARVFTNQSGGLITKQEARTLSLAKLRLKPDAVVWDIGGSLGRPECSAWRRRPRLGHREEQRRCRQRPRQCSTLPHAGQFLIWRMDYGCVPARLEI